MPRARSDATVTLAGIARIAGVGRAAVSNWRRRHDGFPAPVGGSDASPQFPLGEVERWLQEQGKIRSAGGPALLWPQIEALGDRDAAGTVIAAVGARLAGADARRDLGVSPSREQRQLVGRAADLAAREGSKETFERLLSRWLQTHVRQIATTPEPLADLMVQIADVAGSPHPRTVLDPACGTGTLLRAAARQWGDANAVRLRGQDRDPVLAAIAAARLLLAGAVSADQAGTSVTAADTLLEDAHTGLEADVVLSNPPSNERDWGHAELATDPRWAFGQPPRTEPELAWVQHAVSALAPGGTAVLLLPPGVATRRAGRRIRAALLRSGTLRAVVALPPGVAPPYGLGLHLWVLCNPAEPPADTELLVVDAKDRTLPTTSGRPEIDWPGLHDQVLRALASKGASVRGANSLPVIDLLDEQVDLTPARYVPATAEALGSDLRAGWKRLGAMLDELSGLRAALAAVEPGPADGPAAETGTTTLAELERANAVELRAGQAVDEDQLRRGDRPRTGVPVLLVADLLLTGTPGQWMAAKAVSAGSRAGAVTTARPGDIVVSGAARSFDAWVVTDESVVLGPQLYAVGIESAVLEPWFLAGCMRAPANKRQAGTHASTSSRVDVRRLRVPRLGLAEQRSYGETFRKIHAFERLLRDLGAEGTELLQSISDLLAAGRAVPTR
ncbi:N-6 DNA methylase [Streptomyces aculeolatus]|uniref:N-6 DNA methylase n=1 Tax=Streptomyces aculeolatus TaxID=270689 RepID=UPI001CED7034|nr:N-6 DNA methylase [Streptomyces aculeolatus]